MGCVCTTRIHAVLKDNNNVVYELTFERLLNNIRTEHNNTRGFFILVFNCSVQRLTAADLKTAKTLTVISETVKRGTKQ